jgi:hypothetical protein
MHEFILPAVGLYIATDARIYFACGGFVYCHGCTNLFCLRWVCMLPRMHEFILPAVGLYVAKLNFF